MLRTLWKPSPTQMLDVASLDHAYPNPFTCSFVLRFCCHCCSRTQSTAVPSLATLLEVGPQPSWAFCSSMTPTIPQSGTGSGAPPVSLSPHPDTRKVLEWAPGRARSGILRQGVGRWGGIVRQRPIKVEITDPECARPTIGTDGQRGNAAVPVLRGGMVSSEVAGIPWWSLGCKTSLCVF